MGIVERITRALRHTTPVPYAAPLQTLTAWQSGPREEHLRAVHAVGTLYSIIHVMSTSCASVDWHLYRRTRNGERTEVHAHAALDLWNRPNAFQSRANFVEAGQQLGDLTGEIDIVISRDPRSPIPLELWLVRPDKLTPVPHPVDFIDHFEYLGPVGERIMLSRDDVLRIITPDPLDPYRGLSPVASIMNKLEAVDFADAWNRNFFTNGAEPGGLIKVDRMLSDDDFANLRRHWNTQHKGVGNAHRVGILEEGEWVPNAQSMRDMQFVELSSSARETIREAYGIPKFALGLDENVNRATAEASDVVMAKRIIRPRLGRWKELLNTRLLPLYGASDLEFDFEDPEPGDEEAEDRERTSKVNAVVSLIGAGFEPASVLEAMDLPEMEYSKPPPVAEVAPEEVPAGLANLIRPTLRTPRNAADMDPADMPGLDGLQADWEASLARLLKSWDSVTSGWYEEILRQVADAVMTGGAVSVSSFSLPPDVATAEILDAMVSAARDGAASVVEEADAQGVQLEPAIPRTSELEQVAAAIAALGAAELSVGAARELLRTAGRSTTADQAVASIRAYLDQLTDARPTLYLGGALTEAQHAGRLETFASGPQPAYYANEVLDKNTCQECRAVNGRWLGNDLYGDVATMYPTGGYVGCEGRQRCRGQVFGVWRPETVR